EDANIRAMVSMQEQFQVPVGYSDHAPGWTVVLGAVTLGAKVIEKHITLSRKLDGPDHPHSLESNEFAQMVLNIRQIEAALGDGVKRPAEDEMPERQWARRGVYARIDIPAGATLAPEMLYCVRPCVGVAAEHLSQLVGRRLRDHLTAKEPISLDVLRDSCCTPTRSVSERTGGTQARSTSEGSGCLVTAS
ncbi:MAG: N-acetylneuraminate synthase family protein, partial [Planctomycetes bacterium]|nr:N-acetylneuraminate synthase family protein [Planctomycetota bacterium]